MCIKALVMHSKGNNAIAADLNFSWIETNHFFLPQFQVNRLLLLIDLWLPSISFE